MITIYYVLSLLLLFELGKQGCTSFLHYSSSNNIHSVHPTTTSRHRTSCSFKIPTKDEDDDDDDLSEFVEKKLSTEDVDFDGLSFVDKLIEDELNAIPAFESQPPHAESHFRSTHPQMIKLQTSELVGNSGDIGDKQSQIYRAGKNIPKSWKKLRPEKKKRFFEGWYYRLTLPEDNVSFAFIVSIEDPKPNSDLSLSCLQIMGPDDEYLVQGDTDHTKFWAFTSQQALGCIFENKEEYDDKNKPMMIIPPKDFNTSVQSGFQVFPERMQGKLRGHDGTKGGVLNYNTCDGVPGECDFDFRIDPLVGWGGAEASDQKSTAGWLAKYPVFEPHWQVTMADGRATGSVRWKNTTYTFQNAPFYAEKNWGSAFPIKWYWAQCNSWNNVSTDTQLSVTAGGGIRKLPLTGGTESLGMVSVHYNNTFYEATPWLGDMEWKVTPWGSWKLRGLCTAKNKKTRPFYVELEAKCKSTDGVNLRAPTLKDGMVYFCRDSFYANATLSLYELDENNKKGKVILDKVTSNQCAVEIGGGPWWNTWEDTSKMKRVLKFLIRLPYRWKNLLRK